MSTFSKIILLAVFITAYTVFISYLTSGTNERYYNMGLETGKAQQSIACTEVILNAADKMSKVTTAPSPNPDLEIH